MLVYKAVLMNGFFIKKFFNISIYKCYYKSCYEKLLSQSIDLIILFLIRRKDKYESN